MNALLPRSLRARLLVGAFIWITFGVSAAGIFISALFRQHATALVDAEMRGHLQELMSLIDLNSQGGPQLYRALSDPRFSQIGSGYSWQVSRSGTQLIKSTSASTEDIPIPADKVARGELKKINVPGPRGTLIVYESSFSPDEKSDPLRLQVNIDEGIVEAVLRTFNISLAVSLVLLAMALTAAAALQVVFGLQPMTRLGRALRSIRAGKATHLPRSFPLEVQPVVDDLNSVIDINAQMVVRARSQAGNLAHALKTPLAVLTDEAYRLDNRGQRESANVILQQCQRMQRQIDYQIARTRAAASRSVPGLSASITAAVHNIVSAMKRLYAAKNPQIAVSIEPGCTAMCDSMDLNEMLGNLIDNAFKWSSGQIAVSAVTNAETHRVVILVEDDGPGLPQESREMVFQIGQRLDERVPGSGLGLAIVRDLAHLYGGEISLEHSSLGGLKAVLQLPSVASDRKSIPLGELRNSWQQAEEKVPTD